MSPMTNTFKPAEGVAVSADGEGIVLFHVREGLLFRTKRIGALIWRGIERELPAESIAAEVSRKQDIPSGTAQEYTSRFVAELRRHRLIDQVAGP